ncbi:GspA [Fructilactobacillus fructivorans]|nr:GspA [Fructilactobacillus fructivorans]
MFANNFLKGMMCMITIASTTDNNMAIPLAVNYSSILNNNKDSDFEFYVVDDHLSSDSVDLLKSLAKVYDNCKSINFLKPNTAAYKGANVTSPDSAIKENTYYRIELPKEIHRPRILYLDADMTCVGNISDLWDTDLDGNIVGAVEDSGYVDRLKEMHVSDEPGQYFNAGLLLIDTKAWNDNDTSEKVRKLALDKPEMLKYQDQDALNAIFNGHWKKLDPKYNLQSHLVKGESGLNPIPERRAAEAKALKNPVIVHYTNFEKPWIIKNNRLHPLRDYYYQAKNKLIYDLGDYIN